jgi:hypothetical protein
VRGESGTDCYEKAAISLSRGVVTLVVPLVVLFIILITIAFDQLGIDQLGVRIFIVGFGPAIQDSGKDRRNVATHIEVI